MMWGLESYEIWAFSRPLYLFDHPPAQAEEPPCNPGSLSGVISKTSQTLCSWIPPNTPLMLQLNLYLFVFIISSNRWHLFLWWNAERLVIKCNSAHRPGHIFMCGCLFLYVPYMHMFESPAYMCFCMYAYDRILHVPYCAWVTPLVILLPS